VRGLYAISLSAFTVMVGMGIIAPLLPIFAESLGASGMWIGVIFSAYSLSRLSFLPLAGRLSDKYGRRNILLVGLFLYSVISLLYITSRNPAELSIVRFLHGMSSAMIIPVAMAAAAETAVEGKEGYTLGIFNRSLFLGMASGPIIGGFVAELIGLRETFLGISLLSFITLIVSFTTFPEIEVKKSRVRMSKRILTPIIFRFLNSMGRGSILSFLPIYLALIGYGAATIGVLISLNLFVSALIQPVSGRIADRIGAELPVSTSAILSALILMLLPKTTGITALIALSVFLGVSSAFAIPAIGAMVAVEGRGGGMGELMATLSAAKSLGRIVGPVFSGALYDLFGGGLNGISIAFSLAAIISLFSLLIFFSFERLLLTTQKRERREQGLEPPR